MTPGPTETVTGAERLGWTQTAADSHELSTFRQAIYVDGARAELTGVSCQPPSSPLSADFVCSAPLPTMPPGPHTLEACHVHRRRQSARKRPLGAATGEQDKRCGSRSPETGDHVGERDDRRYG